MYEHYWAKADKNDANLWRPFQEHVGAVALCAEAYLAARPLLHERLAQLLGTNTDHVLQIVLYGAALHDLGKLSVGFQSKVPNGFTRTYPQASYALHTTEGGTFVGKIPGLKISGGWNHGVDGYVLWTQVLKSLNMLSDDERRAFQPAAWHHGSPPEDNRKNEIRPWWNNLKRDDPKVANQDVAAVGEFVASVRAALGPLAPTTKFCVEAVQLLAGLVSVADWLGSDEATFPLAASWTARDFGSVFNDATMREQAVARVAALASSDPPLHSFMPARPTALQQAVPAHTGDLTVIEAPTGDGKTEAALVAYETLRRLGKVDRVVFCLPTTATTTAMHGRLCRAFKEAHPHDPDVHIHHGDMRTLRNLITEWNVDADEQGENDSKDFERDWFSSGKRVLLGNAAVTTVDQIMMTTLKGHRHRFVRQMALATSLVIVDEVHTVDVYMEEVLVSLLDILAMCGAKVVLLSATLTDVSRNRLVQAYARGPVDVPTVDAPARITTYDGSACSCVAVASRRPNTPVHVSAIEHDWEMVGSAKRPFRDDVRETLRSLVKTVKAGGCAAWIRNTVWDVQALLSFEEEFKDVETLFLHASLCFDHRCKAERTIRSLLGPKGERRPLLVLGTNILGTSLDVDFDRMVVDLTTMDYMVQAVGRLHRHDRPRPVGMESKVVEVFMPRVLDTSSPYEWTHEGRLVPVAKTWEWVRQATLFEDPGDVRSLLETMTQPPVGDDELERHRIDQLVQEKLIDVASFNISRCEQGKSAMTDKVGAAPTRIGRRAMVIVPVRFEGNCVSLPHLPHLPGVPPVDVSAILGGCFDTRFEAHLNYRRFWRVWKDLSTMVQRGGAKRSTLEARNVYSPTKDKATKQALALTDAWKNTPAHPRDVLFVAVDGDGFGEVVRDRGTGNAVHYKICYGGDRAGLIVERIA